MRKELEEIHESLVNGQRKQMVEQIDEYGLYDFWEDYANYLHDLYVNPNRKYTYSVPESQYIYFVDAVTSYHQIKAR